MLLALSNDNFKDSQIIRIFLGVIWMLLTEAEPNWNSNLVVAHLPPYAWAWTTFASWYPQWRCFKLYTTVIEGLCFQKRQAFRKSSPGATESVFLRCVREILRIQIGWSSEGRYDELTSFQIQSHWCIFVQDKVSWNMMLVGCGVCVWGYDTCALRLWMHKQSVNWSNIKKINSAYLQNLKIMNWT